ncbi:GNAT family N-acetyltransferase [Amorphus sp. 3PC139-8]|uniref:GNAT family N-acetyltransferase n=1 Tax=Amorphus sp. 3PC139-8 TaxID=2735676 RepID=UPI00345DE2C4
MTSPLSDPAAPITPPSVTIRRAGIADLPALETLEQASFASDRLSRRSLRTLIARPSASVLVAETAQGLAGSVLVLFRRNTRAGRVYSLAVRPEARGAGIAAMLMAAAEREAASRGAEVIRLEVRADNPPAIALYRKLGYRQIGHRKAYYQDGEDALRFGKSLVCERPVRPGVFRHKRRPHRPGEAS